MKYEIGDILYCIKDYQTLKRGRGYNVAGFGTTLDINGKWISARNIRDDDGGFIQISENDIGEYFIPYELYWKSYQRNLKLKKLGI